MTLGTVIGLIKGALSPLKSALTVITEDVSSVEKSSTDISSLLGQATTSSKEITGDSTYKAIIKMNLYANTLYYMNLKLKSAAQSAVYVGLFKSDGTVIGYSDSIPVGESYIYKAVTPSADCIGAEFKVSSATDFEVEYANLFSNNDLLKQIARTITGDDITMLSVTSSNKKSITGTGEVKTETDSSMYVTEEITIKPGHWYMVTASAGYASSYYAIYDENHNCMIAERSPSGSSTALVNRMVYMPQNSKYIRIANVSSVTGSHIAECNTIKTKKYEAPEWWDKFLAISYSDIGG